MSRKLIQDDKELLQVSQMELKKLQRQYRIMEGDKNSYASEIKCYLSKQRKIIETLSNEEKTLASKISVEKPETLEFNNQWRKNFNELLRTYEKYMISIKPKKDTIAKLDKKIKKLQDETKVLLYYGDSKTIQINESIEKSANKIHLLQNKLYNETVKYDKALAENLQTRQAVDALLKDRAKFNDSYKKLVMKLNSDKKKLLFLIEQATIACEQRDEADEKLKSTLNREQQEAIAQSHKMRELHRQLDHLIQLKEFISIKGQKRVLVDLVEKENEKKQMKIQQTELYMKKRTSILEQIKEFCNETAVEKLANIFIKQEEENFALFNYINEINNEVEILQDEVNTLQAQLEEQRKLNSSVQKQTSRSLDSFRSDLEARKESVEQLREASSASASVLELLFSEIESIFSLFKRSNPSIIRLLGEKQVSSENAELFLDIMTKKIEDSTINS